MTKIVLSLFISLLVFSSCAQEQLTTEQKGTDFEYLYQTLKDNYPYFGVCKRQNGVDWLANKEEYLALVKETNSDEEYLFAIDSILRTLGNGHVDIGPTKFWQYFKLIYKKATIDYPNYQKWVEVFENPIARPLYWQKILAKQSQNSQTYKKPKKGKVASYRDSILYDGKIGIIRISTFNQMNIEKEGAQIDSFLKRIATFNSLIIDIQGNSGGSTEYWAKNIVSKLIQDTIHCSEYILIKDGLMNKSFYSEHFKEAAVVRKNDSLPKIPEELLDGTYYLKTSISEVSPNNQILFKGKIYLLVDSHVFSSAEAFAYFCKATHFATVVGEQTGGDGIGSDPIPVVLPESGIVIRYPASNGFNPDGSLNFEERTMPDMILRGQNADERLQNLLEYLRRA